MWKNTWSPAEFLNNVSNQATKYISECKLIPEFSAEEYNGHMTVSMTKLFD